MASLNKVMIIGNLTADPEVRSTPRGNNLTEFRVAVTRYTTGANEGERREETAFLDVTCWGRQAEVAAQYLAKGRPVFVEGRLQQDTWEDKQTGQRRSKIRIIAENIQFLNGRADGAQGGPAPQQRSYGNNGGNYGGNGGYNNGGNYNNGGSYGNGNAGYGNNGGYRRDAGAPQGQSRPAPQGPPPPEDEGDDIPF
ncbi:MAG: single-stranded DNA-binding protein [Akkermansia muciniphila]